MLFTRDLWDRIGAARCGQFTFVVVGEEEGKKVVSEYTADTKEQVRKMFALWHPRAKCIRIRVVCSNAI